MTTVQSSKVMPKVKTQQHRSSFFTGIIFLFIIFSLLEINFLFSSNSIKSNLGYDSFLILNRLYYLTENLNAFYPLIVGSHLVNGQNIIVPYLSQLGLQGVIISNITQFLDIDPLLSAFTFSHIFVLILSLVFAILFTSLSKYFGFFPSLIGILLLGFSPWIALFGFSLYWTAFLLFIPFTICWLFYPYFVENQKSRPFFIFAIALSVCLKCLCGYEYITNVILSCIVPIYFYHFQNKSLNKQFIKNIIIILGAGVLGFIAAIGIHSLQLSLLFNTNGLELIAQRAKDRTGVTLAIPDRLYINNSIDNLPENSWINQAVQNNWISPVIAFGILSFFKYFSFSAAELPNILQNKNISISIGSFTLVSLFLLLLLGFKLIKFNRIERNLIFSTNLGLLLSLSWQVLAFNHMSIHLHLNGIVYYIPFLIMMYLSVGVLLQKFLILLNEKLLLQKRIKLLLQKGRKRIRKPLVYFILTILILLSTTSYIKEIAKQQTLAIVVGNSENSTINSNVNSNLHGHVDLIHILDVNPNIHPEVARTPFIKSARTKTLMISGWAIDFDNPKDPVEIFIFYNGLVLKSEKTNFLRADVTQVHGVPAPKAGFNINFLIPERIENNLGIQPIKIDPETIKDKIQVYAVSINKNAKIIRLK